MIALSANGSSSNLPPSLLKFVTTYDPYGHTHPAFLKAAFCSDSGTHGKSVLIFMNDFWLERVGGASAFFFDRIHSHHSSFFIAELIAIWLALFCLFLFYIDNSNIIIYDCHSTPETLKRLTIRNSLVLLVHHLYSISRRHFWVSRKWTGGQNLLLWLVHHSSSMIKYLQQNCQGYYPNVEELGRLFDLHGPKAICL